MLEGSKMKDGWMDRPVDGRWIHANLPSDGMHVHYYSVPSLAASLRKPAETTAETES